MLDKLILQGSELHAFAYLFKMCILNNSTQVFFSNINLIFNFV